MAWKVHPIPNKSAKLVIRSWAPPPPPLFGLLYNRVNVVLGTVSRKDRRAAWAMRYRVTVIILGFGGCCLKKKSSPGRIKGFENEIL